MLDANDAQESSADQIAWLELAQAIRGHLANAAKFMPAMNPSELQSFVGTVKEALWLEQNAAEFDHQIEKQQTNWS